MIAKTTRPASRLLAAIACLLPLVPVLLWPGLGVLASVALMALGLLFFAGSRGPTLAMVWKGRLVSLALGVAVGAGLAWTIANLVRPFVEDRLGSSVAIAGMEQVAGNAGLLAFTLLVTLASAVLEELVFRGYVIGWGSQIFGKAFAPILVLLSSAVFGFAHLEFGPAGAVITGFAGLVLGTLYLVCGRRLLPCVAAHMTFNAIGSAAFYFAT